MEEVSEDDLEAQFIYTAMDSQHRSYQIHINTYTIGIIGPEPKVVQLSIDQTLHWLSDDCRMIAFGINVADQLQYYYAANNDLIKMREIVKCKISFSLINQEYIIDELIGKGSFSEVFKITHIATHKDYALKCIKLRVNNEKEHLEQIKKEVKTLVNMHHDSVIQIQEVYKLNDDTYGLVTEWVEGQTLDSVLNKQRQLRSKLSEKDIQMIMYECLKILNYLNSQGIIHRDIKPANLILSSANGHKSLKVIDFGLSLWRGESSNSRSGTPGYMNPEIFDKCEWTPKCDMFSLGIVFYKLLNRGSSCFEGPTTEQVLSKNRRCKIDFTDIKGYSDQALNLVQGMLNKDPQIRFDPKQAMRHPFFTHYAIQSGDWNIVLNEQKVDICVYQKHPRPSHLSRQSTDDF